PMEHSARRIPRGEDLRSIADITFVPSVTIRPPRIEQARVAFECVLDRIIPVGTGIGGGNLILGCIQRLHVSDTLVIDGREIDWRGLDPLGRLSGNRYCAVRSVIESETN
ncbi:MAG TPA: hypothetical protein P5559_04845, partial [Candidatus Limiplasma sp.]|nr:hypothetical protein [Candidatus Limiplasma sp.]